MNNIDITSSASQPTAAPIHMLLERIKSEFIEMPGLQLTPWQAQRLWGLAPLQCDAILAALVDVAFLRRTAGGAYVRAAN